MATAARKLANLKVQYPESDAEIDARIAERFEILDILSEACVVGNTRAMVVSGPPGLGKSFTVEKNLSLLASGQFTIAKGYTRPTGLLKLLYEFRHPGNVIVFDDIDSVFSDDICLNLLKTVCDTTEHRMVSWLSEGILLTDEGERIPRTFEFQGSIIFITNIDFDALIAKKHKLTPHLEALMSRSHYLDLTMKSKRDYLVRIRQVIKQGMLSELSVNERNDVIDFIDDNYDKLRELSLRAAIKLGNLRKTAKDWRKIARITMLKQ